MLAAVYHGANDLRVETYPIPTISPDELLLKVVNSSICGTDLRILHGGHRMYPDGTVRIPGHEVVGDVVEVGANVKGITEGQRVFVAPNMGCGHCRQCISGNNNLCANYVAFGITLDGAFAEYMRVPAAAILQGNLFVLDDGVDPAVAALTEPFACVLRGQNAVNVHAGDVAVVVGAGPIGLMHVQLARLRGAVRVIVSEMIPERRDQALNFGADAAVTPDQLAETVRGGESRRRRGRGDRRRARSPSAGSRAKHCGDWRADQLLRRAAERSSDHHAGLECRALQGVDRHRDDGVQHAGLPPSGDAGQFGADRPRAVHQRPLSAGGSGAGVQCRRGS